MSRRARQEAPVAPDEAAEGSVAAPGPLDQPAPRRPRDFGIDTGRLRRLRLVTFAILALPLLALTLLLVRLVSMPLTQMWHDAAYDKGQYARASEHLWPVDHLNWFEPYLPHLTRGTDLLQAGDDAAAEKELRTSLTLWQGASDLNQPQHAQCKILNNLAISIERQAAKLDDESAKGDRLYEAEQLLAPCASGGGSGDGEGQGGQGDGEGQQQGGEGDNGNEDRETTQGNKDRIEEERKDADEKAGKDPSDRPGTDEGQDAPPSPSTPARHEDPSGSESPEEAPSEADSTEKAKQDELDDRNDKANEGQGESEDAGSSERPDKPW